MTLPGATLPVTGARGATATGAGRVGIARGARRSPLDRPRGLWVVTGVLFLFLFAPIVVVVVFSFNSGSSTSVFAHPSLRWYRTLLHDGPVHASFGTSLEVGAATMILATAVGTGLALAFERWRSRSSRVTEATMMLNVVSPEIATAVAALLIFTQLGITLSLATVVLANTTWTIAYVALIVRARIAGLPKALDEAAMDLYATERQTLWLVTFPLLWPAIAASALLTFVMSFDDFVTTYFTSGVGVPPLPVRIYSMLRFGITPEINAIGTVMIIVTVGVALLAVGVFSVGRSGRGRSAAAEMLSG